MSLQKTCCTSMEQRAAGERSQMRRATRCPLKATTAAERVLAAAVCLSLLN
jgi:hypothetical protein